MTLDENDLFDEIEREANPPCPPGESEESLLVILKMNSHDGYAVVWCLVPRDPTDRTVVDLKRVESDVVHVVGSPGDVDHLAAQLESEISNHRLEGRPMRVVNVDLRQNHPTIQGISYWGHALAAVFNELSRYYGGDFLRPRR